MLTFARLALLMTVRNGDSTAVGLMRRVKQRFDPAGACSPGVMAGGI